MKVKTLLLSLLLVLLFVGVGCDCGKPYKMVDGRIVLKTPERPKGQQEDRKSVV